MEAYKFFAGFPAGAPYFTQLPACRIGFPVRRTQTLHPAPFLINQYRGISFANRLPEFIYKPVNLTRILNIAGKKYQPPWMFVINEIALVTG
jgi:hypothetical protein